MRTQNPVHVHEGNTDYIQISQQSRYFVVIKYGNKSILHGLCQNILVHITITPFSPSDAG